MTRLSSRGQIVIPRGLRKDFKEGDTFIVFRRGDEIILKSAQKIVSETALMSEKSLSKEWLNPEEEEAWKDL